MKLLIVSATPFEIRPLLAFLGEDDLKNKDAKRFVRGELTFDVLITGVGMAATGFHLGKQLALQSYDLALNLGVAGAFDKKLLLGEVVQIQTDCFADLGAEYGEDGFMDLAELNLQEPNQPPFENGRLVSELSLTNKVLKELKSVSSITVNTASGQTVTIEAKQQRYQPAVESMEGAAFMYGCLTEQIPCLQIRSVSNYVEPRQKDNWDLKQAIQQLNDWTKRFLKTLTEEQLQTIKP